MLLDGPGLGLERESKDSNGVGMPHGLTTCTQVCPCREIQIHFPFVFILVRPDARSHAILSITSTNLLFSSLSYRDVRLKRTWRSSAVFGLGYKLSPCRYFVPSVFIRMPSKFIAGIIRCSTHYTSCWVISSAFSHRVIF